MQGHHVRGGGGEPVANKRPRLPKRRRQPSGLKERRKMERKSWEGGGREGASLRKRRRRHRCRGVINGRGRRGSVHLSYLCKKPKTARHPITTLANCYPVACLWLRKQILADWRRVGTRKVALDLASVLRLYGANNVSARCLLLSPLILFAIVFGRFPPEIARSNVGRRCNRRRSWGEHGEEVKAAGQCAMERILWLSTKLAKCDTQRG